MAANIKEKRFPPPNERFQNIKSVVDSGFNEIKLKQYLADQRLNTRFQRRENFSRIKVWRLQQSRSPHHPEASRQTVLCARS